MVATEAGGTNPTGMLSCSFQILIKVAVAAVNPSDTWCRDNDYPEWSMKLYVPSFPWTPGRDVAGTVEKIGSKVTRVKVRKSVMYILRFQKYL